ncbi:MAG: hypothetical protein ACTTJW_05740 [Sphaerochaeta sp.]
MKAGNKAGKGIVYTSASICEKSFAAAQAVGFALIVTGIVTIVLMSRKPFVLTNLRPLFIMISGMVFTIVGIIIVGVYFGIRWKKRILERISAIEGKWHPAVKSVSGLKRAYNINRTAKLREKRQWKK